ncbi:MAG: pantoate--beta-alanine ligase [Candidatus Dadabacteria bacterium]|nr:MAG: pantoate--beta-alanine ligase [Candidatus Dadabacteria bacterium]
MIVKGIEEARESIRRLRNEGRSKIGFVPTMGYLHEGHLSLCDIALSKGDGVVVSIFVNPTQFNDPADLESYPRDIDRDISLLNEKGVDVVFVPSTDEIYGADFCSSVRVSQLTERFEGASRPGHFEGVTTVVSILFNILNPDFAVFGEKDFQQLRVIERMVKDLKFPIEIVRGKLIREDDGLALSSRNVRLSKEGRTLAPAIYQALKKGADAFKSGERNGGKIASLVKKDLAAEPKITVDYLCVVDEETLSETTGPITSPSRILFAGYIDGIRLIDNMPLAF